MSADLIQKCATEFGTPTFMFDEALFRQRISTFKNTLASTFGTLGIETEVQYAAKAFISRDVAKIVSHNGLNIDTCSLVESMTATSGGAPGNTLCLHGNNKSDAELEYAIKNDFAKIFVDNFAEIGRIQEIASVHNKVANILLRITVGVHAGGHEFISTGHEDQKFGILPHQALDYIAEIQKCSNLHFAGIHSHIGSQIWDNAAFIEALTKMLDLRQQIYTKFNICVDEIDLGGGFGVQYIPSEPEIDLLKLFNALSTKIKQEFDSPTEITPCKFSFEPGRWLIAPCMQTIYRIGVIKDVEYESGKFRRYISVDGGMSDNIRPALYGAEYSCYVLPSSAANSTTDITNTNSENLKNCRIVGKHCESGDILINDVLLPDNVSVGDLLIIPVTGAYGYSMASNYNGLPKPAVVTLTPENELKLMIARQTPEELIK